MYRGGFGTFGYFLTPWIKRLVVANTLFFLLTWTGVIPREWAVQAFGFSSSYLLSKPWTVITYMFVHANFLHVFINMLMLFFFGPPLEERWGGREFIKFYAICGVGGAFFTFIFGGDIPIVGASGAVLGVLLAYALNWPDNLIWIWAIFPIKAKYLVLILGAISFFSAFSGSSGGIAHFAHLGGLVVGYVYLKKGWAVQARFEGLKRRFRMRKFSVVPGGKSDSLATGQTSRADEEARVLEEVDRLLDKIAAEGMGSLTPKEKSFLDEVSRRRQARH